MIVLIVFALSLILILLFIRLVYNILYVILKVSLYKKEHNLLQIYIFCLIRQKKILFFINSPIFNISIYNLYIISYSPNSATTEYIKNTNIYLIYTTI
jgi:hypothetical protein